MHNIIKKYLSDRNRKAAVEKWKGMSEEERKVQISKMTEAARKVNTKKKLSTP